LFQIVKIRELNIITTSMALQQAGTNSEFWFHSARPSLRLMQPISANSSMWRHAIAGTDPQFSTYTHWLFKVFVTYPVTLHRVNDLSPHFGGWPFT